MITEQWLEEKRACFSSVQYAKEANWIGLSIDESIDLLIWSEKYSDANWLITNYMNKKQNIQYAIFAAEQVLEIFEKKYPEDKKPRKAIETAKTYIENPCDQTRKAAYDAAAYAASDAPSDDYAAAAYAAFAAAFAASDDSVYAFYAVYAAYAASAAYYADAAANLRVKILRYGLSLLNLEVI